MTKTHFTPGPWAPEKGEDGTHTISSVDGTAVAFWVQPNNRHILAAAPDLYAALEALLNDVCEMKDVDLDVIYEGRNGSLSKAKTALKKARGQS